MRILFDHGGELAEEYAAVDWDASPLGRPETWSPTLRTTVDMMVRSRFPMTLLWGTEAALVYNQAYVELIQDKHPAALGRPAKEIFPEAWDLISPMLEQVRTTQQATYLENEYVPLVRRGFLEECYFTFSYSAVRNLDGHAEGVLDVATETTREVVFRRRMNLLRRLALRLPSVSGGPGRIVDAALDLLEDQAADIARVGVVGYAHDIVPTELGPRWDGRPLVVRIPTSGERARALRVVPASTVVVDEDYRAFLGLVAAAVGQALERHRLDEVQGRANEAQREMTEAFQRSLLPRLDPLRSPQMAVRYRPAVELAKLGGDWYDVFALPDGSLDVVIGDVAGHDQRAAADMAQMRHLVRGVALSIASDSPARVLAGLEKVLAVSSSDALATAVLARVSDLDAGRLQVTWSNAGHPPPVLVEADGGVRLLRTEPDLLLGLDAGAERSEHQVVLEPGATLVLYTDGLVESRLQRLEDGLDRLVGTLAGAQRRNLENLCDHLLESAPGREDDVALLVLRG